jgi:hypothetical protein
VFISVDTEEDSWGDYQSRYLSTANAKRLHGFQRLCERYGAVPTYLVDYPMTKVEPGPSVLRELAGAGCEIGAHCHPWNTPPIEEELGERNSMLSNLPPGLVRAKMGALHAAVLENIGVAPVSFRAGRWALSASVTSALAELGYRVDTSISPFVDWRNFHGPDFRETPHWPFRFDPDEPLSPSTQGQLVQVPASVGFLQRDQLRAHRFREWVRSVAPRQLRAIQILDRMRVLNRRWLSPEQSDGRDLVLLAQAIVAEGIPSLNLSFHSCSLEPGLTPYVRSEKDRREFFRRIEEFFDFATRKGMRFATLGEAPDIPSLFVARQDP